jgi:hypothetical protein
VPREDSPYITPVSEFSAFLSGLKTQPGLVMVAGMMGSTDLVEVADDPIQPGIPALVPSCAIPETQVGTTPPIRLAALAESFPSRFVFENLCDAGTSSEHLRRVTRATTGIMSRRPCLLGNIDYNLTTERCRAFDAIGDTRNRIEACDGAIQTSCFYIEPSLQCEYTSSQMAARYRGTLPDGHRLVVECLTD